MVKKWITGIGCGMLATSLVVAGHSFAESNHEVQKGTIRLGNQTEADFSDMAKLSIDQSVGKALNAVQGKVLKVELENENGFLVYGVEVVTGKDITQVMVDAGTGAILAMERDKTDTEAQKTEEQREDEEDRG